MLLGQLHEITSSFSEITNSVHEITGSVHEITSSDYLLLGSWVLLERCDGANRCASSAMSITVKETEGSRTARLSKVFPASETLI